MGASQRRKGHAFEREVCAMLRGIHPSVTAKRTLTETREGNQGDVETNLPLSVQCKVGASPPVYAALAQAVEAAGDSGKLPVAFLRRNSAKNRDRVDFVVLRTEDFLNYVGLYHALRNTSNPTGR